MAHFAKQEGVYANPVPRLTDPEAKTYVTTGLLAINVIVFLAMVFSGASPLDPKTGELARFGGSWAYALFEQHWRLLTATYVHAGIIHIGFNMWCLWNLGSLAERIFDRWVFFVIYTCCGLAGSIAAAWSTPNAVTVGASGAVFGLAGALISTLYLGKLPVAKHAMQSTLKSLLLFAGYNLFFGAIVPYISNSAHVGGLLTGLGLGALLAPSLTSPSPKRQLWSIVVVAAGAFLLLIEFYIARVLLLGSAGR